MKIADIEKKSRPREKALRYGIEAITNQELLAIIIGSGVKNKSAIEIAGSLLADYKNFSSLAKASLPSLKSEKGINSISALKLMATFEFSSRLLKEKREHSLYIKNSDELYSFYSQLEEENNEIFIIVMLNKNGKILKEKRITICDDSFIGINLKDIFVELFQNEASKFALIHNHPGGTKFPSQEDVKATLAIKGHAQKFELILFDHIIIYDGGYYSFKKNKLIW